MRRPSAAKARRGTPVSDGYSLPAPTGGLNKRDSIVAMAETDAINMKNVFPGTSDVRVRRGTTDYAAGFESIIEALMPYNAADGTQKMFAASDGRIVDISSEATVANDKFYLMGLTGENVYSGEMLTPGDMATAVSGAGTMLFGSQDDNPEAIRLKTDGTKIYMLGAGTQTIYAYALSSAYDLGTSSYGSESYDYTSVINLPPADVEFKSDGTKMYLLVGSGVYQFSLSTAWDVSTATYDNVFYDPSEATPYAVSMRFGNSGAKLYVVSQSEIVYEYDLSSAWDMTTASYSGNSVSVAAQDSTVGAIAMKADGTALYTIGQQNDTIYQYTLSVAWDISSASYASKSLATGSAIPIPTSFDFKSDGTQVYLLDGKGAHTGAKAFTFDLSSAWDISTGAESTNAFDTSTQTGGAPKGICFSPDLSKMYVGCDTNNLIYQYTLSTPGVLSTASYDTKTLDPTGQTSDVGGIYLKPDGTAMYVIDASGAAVIYQYTLSTPYDISTGSYASKSYTVAGAGALGLHISSDGTEVYTTHYNAKRIYQTTLGTPWDISTGSDTGFYAVDAQAVFPTGVALSSDGTTMYVLDSDTGGGTTTIYQYSLSTAWDITSASYASKSFDISSMDSSPQEIYVHVIDFDVEGLTNNRWQHVNFANSAGTSYLCCFNGADSPQYFDGTSWTAITGVSSPAITGITTTDIVSAFAHKRRMYLILNNSLSFYYLPVDSVGGAANPIDLGGIATKGGFIKAGETWTLDAGAGVDDYCAVITSEGQLIVFQGTDPSSASTWLVKGVWEIGEPIGRRCMLKYQGDLLIITTQGIVSCNRIMVSGQVDDRAKISDKISGAVSDDITSYKANFGWQMSFYPEQDMLLLNVPVTEGSSYKQYAMNTITGAWGGPFDGINAACWTKWNENLYCGTSASVKQFWNTKSDSGTAISFDVRQAYTALGSRGIIKNVKAVRPYIESDGAFAMNVGINTNYSTDDVAGSVNSGEQRYSDWDAVAGIGSAISVQYKGEIAGTDFRLQASDIVYEKGGIIG